MTGIFDRTAWLRCGVSLGLLLLISACAGEDDASSTSTVIRDSAEVRIIEFGERLGGGAIGWTFTGPPEYGVDNDETDPDYQLFEVVDAMSTGDGGLAIANSGTHEIRFYDAFGDYEGSYGRLGDGPGEFRNIGWMRYTVRGEIAVGDRRARRITVFDRDRELVRTVDMSAATGSASDVDNAFSSPPDPLAMLFDGSTLAATYAPYPGNFEGAVRLDVTLWRIGPEPGGPVRVGGWLNDEAFLFSTGDFVSVSERAFSRSTYVDFDGSGFWVGDNDTWEIRGYGASGALHTIIRRDDPPLPVTEELVLQEMEARYRDVDDGPRKEQMITEQLELERHETMPAFGDLRVVPDGAVWVQEFARTASQQRFWISIDLESGTLGRLVLPTRFRVLRFEREHVILVETDEFGRESVHRYGLRSR